MQDRDQRTILLLGKENFDNIKHSSIAVIGLGGVGSYALEALARCGVGHLTIVDPDQVDISNVNRQLPALYSTVGRYKTDVMQERLLDINPDLQIRSITKAYCLENSDDILGAELNMVVDAIDSIPEKIHLIKQCLAKKIPIVSSMGAANRLDPAQFMVADIKDTSVCPLAKKVRRELRSEGIHEGLTVVFSKEQPIQPKQGSGAGLGSISFVPPAAGLLLASAAVNILIEKSADTV
ncbi:MAG: tRNA threonylcarbamoyladenosine dehydratase [Bacillota bacterium]|nr:tRNA threonylcarbamoyladenosine dehydratase [Bacillota bacterium]